MSDGLCAHIPTITCIFIWINLGVWKYVPGKKAPSKIVPKKIVPTFIFKLFVFTSRMYLETLQHMDLLGASSNGFLNLPNATNNSILDVAGVLNHL